MISGAVNKALRDLSNHITVFDFDSRSRDIQRFDPPIPYRHQASARINGFVTMISQLHNRYCCCLRKLVSKTMGAKDRHMTFDIEKAASRFAEFIRQERHLVRTEPGEPSFLPNQRISELTEVPGLLVELWMKPLRHCKVAD